MAAGGIITPRERIEIQRRRRTGERLASIARDFPQVSVNAIKWHVRGIKIPDSIQRKGAKRFDTSRALEMKQRGYTLNEIGAVLNMTESGVSAGLKRAREARA